MRTELLAWYESNGRHDLPWRATHDPYKILISEMMLQQTQVPRVIPKYEAFLRAFPTIRALARAPRTRVLRLWQGLGYNNRAVRLHALAKIIVEEHEGKLPTNEESLRALPGIGPYTAGAILIFAHNTPAHSIDVNVARVIRRVQYTQRQRPTPHDVAQRAHELLLASKRPHDWHSALMDLGSTICAARAPACYACPLRAICKSKGVRADERAAKKQATFKGSNRWWRGQILKHALAGTRSRSHLLKAITDAPSAEDQRKFEAAFVQLECEGLLSKR